MKLILLKSLLVGVLLLALGCAERKMTVTSDPPGAVVFLDGAEKGVTPVTFKFNWYGGRRFLLRRDGYQVCEEIHQVSAPLFMKFPLDAVWDLTPLPATDHKKFHFTLVEETDVDVEALRQRADQMRRQAHGEPQTPPTEADTPTPGPEAAPEAGSQGAGPVEEPTSTTSSQGPGNP